MKIIKAIPKYSLITYFYGRTERDRQTNSGYMKGRYSKIYLPKLTKSHGTFFILDSRAKTSLSVPVFIALCKYVVI